MKTRLNYIIAAALAGVFAVSADAIDNKSPLTGVRPPKEAYVLSQNDSVMPTIKPYHCL